MAWASSQRLDADGRSRRTTPLTGRLLAVVRRLRMANCHAGECAMREENIMSTPYARGRSLAAGFLALSLLVSAFSAAFLLPAGGALADGGVAVGDTLILDGPGGQYGILT